ncbi:hypothetical protein ACHQM5_019746 [Ranunculus cassubicifolius]
MIILKKEAVVDGGGTVFMVPQEPDDLWSLFNCISKGDLISTGIDKRIYYQKTPPGAKILVEFYVDTFDYDHSSSVIHLHGSIISDDTPTFVRRSLRDLEIKQNFPCRLTKTTWSNSELDSLVTSTTSSDSSGSINEQNLAVVLIPEKGLANIFLAGKSGWPKVCAKIKDECPSISAHRKAVRVSWSNERSRADIPYPKQRSRAIAPSLKESNNDRFFGSILTAFQEHVDFKTVKHVVIAGPGGLKEKFHSYLFTEARKSKLKSIMENKSRFVLVPTDSRNFKEILEMAAIKKFVKETVDVEDSNVMDELDFLNATDADRACYGWKSVDIANKLAAIRTLLVTENLLRSPDLATRKKYGTLVESVKKSGGTTQVLYCDRESGKRLGVLTGVAAILRFRVPDLDDIEL